VPSSYSSGYTGPNGIENNSNGCRAPRERRALVDPPSRRLIFEHPSSDRILCSASTHRCRPG
jgi:hypothetical protein